MEWCCWWWSWGCCWSAAQHHGCCCAHTQSLLESFVSSFHIRRWNDTDWWNSLILVVVCMLMATIFWPRRTTRRRRMLRRTVHGNSIDLQSLVISVTIVFFSSTSFYVRRVGMDFFVLNRSWILSAVCSEQKPQFHFSSQYNTTQYNTIQYRWGPMKQQPSAMMRNKIWSEEEEDKVGYRIIR